MSARGMNALDLRPIDGMAHIRQSIADILTTPIGSRVMRRDYGSKLFELIDANIQRETVIRVYAAVADALRKWEPRVRVTRVQASGLPDETASGRLEIDLHCELVANGQPITFEGLVL